MLKAITIIVSGFLLVAIGCSKADKPPEIRKVLIHYIGWDIDTRVRLSCQDLVDRGDSVVIVNQSKVEEFVSVVRTLQLTEMPGYDGVDARICLRLFDRNNTVTRTIGISYTRLMEIDGHVYEVDAELFDLIISCLPENYLEPIPTLQ